MAARFKTYFRCPCGLEEHADSGEVVVCLSADRVHRLDRFGVRTEHVGAVEVGLVTLRLTLTDLELRRLHWKLAPADIVELALHAKLLVRRNSIWSDRLILDFT